MDKISSLHNGGNNFYLHDFSKIFFPNFHLFLCSFAVRTESQVKNFSVQSIFIQILFHFVFVSSLLATNKVFFTWSRWLKKISDAAAEESWIIFFFFFLCFTKKVSFLEQAGSFCQSRYKHSTSVTFRSEPETFEFKQTCHNAMKVEALVN